MKSHRLITEGGTNTPVTNINSKSSESLHFNPNLPENFKRFNNILQAAPSHVKTLSCQQQHCSTVGGCWWGGCSSVPCFFFSSALGSADALYDQPRYLACSFALHPPTRCHRRNLLIFQKCGASHQLKETHSSGSCRQPCLAPLTSLVGSPHDPSSHGVSPRLLPWFEHLTGYSELDL